MRRRHADDLRERRQIPQRVRRPASGVGAQSRWPAATVAIEPACVADDGDRAGKGAVGDARGRGCAATCRAAPRGCRAQAGLSARRCATTGCGRRALGRAGRAGHERHHEDGGQQHSRSVTMHCRRRGWLEGVVLPSGAARLRRIARAPAHRAPCRRRRVRPGITRAARRTVSRLIRGKRIALLTNQTGVDEHGVSDIELLRERSRARGRRPARHAVLARAWDPRHRGPRAIWQSGIDERSGLAGAFALHRRRRSRRRTACSATSTRSCSICRTSARGRGRTSAR